MPRREQIIDLATIDLGRVVADVDEIRRHNPQRHQMEQLTAIVYCDPENHVCVGYKDVTRDEFWVTGHMPGRPLMPGVIMCEAAAQLCGYYAQRNRLMAEGHIVGFGGMDRVRFRDPVIPGDRLVIAAKLLKLRAGRMVNWLFQGFVRQALVVEGEIWGVALPIESVPAVESERE